MATPAHVTYLNDVELQAWRGFLEAHRRVVDVLEAELREQQGMALSWYDVLVQLVEAPDRSLRMQELAEAVLISKSGLTRLIDRMESEGLVTREAAADDGRGVLAVMTDKGYDTLRHAAPTHVQGVRDHFVDVLTGDEIATLADVLNRIAARACGRDVGA